MKIWRNDELVEATSEYLTPDGWARGKGIFETIKTVNSTPYALSRHMRRATRSALSLGFSMPSQDHVLDAIDALLKAEPHTLGRLRLSFSLDGVFTATHEQYIEISEPFLLQVIESDQFLGDSHKRFPYTERLAALEASKSAGFDEIVYINKEGIVTEGAISNLLFLIADQWVTPPISIGVLPGVTRALAIEKLGVRVTEIKKSDLAQVQAALVVSSLKIAHPVAVIDGVKLKSLDKAQAFADEIRHLIEKISVG